MRTISILRAGPLVTVQDEGRPGLLAHGITASGALDRHAFRLAEQVVGVTCGAALEFSSLGLSFRYRGAPCRAGFAGGHFTLSVNGALRPWPCTLELFDGDVVDIGTGAWGNYGYLRLEAEIGCSPLLGSRSTNAVVGLGGFQGRALVEGDEITLVALETDPGIEVFDTIPLDAERLTDPIRIVWSLHADLFSADVRSAFLAADFPVTARMDRMGVRLKDTNKVFKGADILSLVSDSIVAGDIQILGDGTPIVLLRDHQPTGGYPRIATVISADFDRFVQIRPGKTVRFTAVTLESAQAGRSVEVRK